MSREKDFIEAAERLAETKRTEDAKQQCLYDFGIAADYGYQYALQHPQWIPVEEELPQADGRYIIADKYGGVEQMNFDAESKYWWLRGTGKMSDFVTHWMPLPEAPRKED